MPSAPDTATAERAAADNPRYNQAVRARLSVLVLLAGAVFVHSPTGGKLGKSHAAPTIEVRARTVVQLKPIVRTRDGIRLSGSISDRSSPDPVAQTSVIITVDDRIYTTISDEDGRFELDIPSEEGTYNIQVSFPGEGLYDPSSQTIEDFDVENEPLELALAATSSDDETWEITLRSHSAGRPVDVSAVLWGGDVSDPELSRLAELATDQRGRATTTVTRQRLGGFGDKRLEVRFGGDDTYDAAMAATTFSINAATATTLAIDATVLAFEDDLRGRGTATDEEGEPLPGQRVVLEAAGKALAEGVTSKSGQFDIKVEASELGEGKVAVQAALYPNERWLSVSRSAPIAISIAERKPVPVGATIAAFGATLAALLAFIAFRTKPWERWLERFAKREPEVAAATRERSGRRAPGLAPARPSLVSTLRRPSDFGFTGHVFDVVTGRAIRGATIKLRGQSDPDGSSGSLAKMVTEIGGAFAFEDLAGGTWSVEVVAAGYMPEGFEIALPHKGDLRSAHVELLAVREFIFDRYGEVVMPLLPGSDRWGVWTPRQIVNHVRSTRPSQALARLTDVVEELYFSQRTPGVDALEAVIAQVNQARLELGGPSAVPSPTSTSTVGAR